MTVVRRIRTLIVDDEPLARRKIRRMLAHDLEVEILGDCANGREAIAAISTHNPSLVFLDVQMPEIDGFDVLESIPPAGMPFVIFVTAYDQYALRAFEVSAVDYLVKPHTERLVIKAGGRAFFLKTEEIDWIEAEGKYVRLHVGKESYLLREAIGSMEGQLDPRRFPRIHRSTIVNIERVRELQPWFHNEYRVILNDGTELMLSRGCRKRLSELLGAAL